jgi:hypothetical protein
MRRPMISSRAQPNMAATVSFGVHEPLVVHHVDACQRLFDDALE